MTATSSTPGYAVGPRITLDYRLDETRNWEVAYLAVRNLTDTQTIGPESPANWYVMRAPGFWQTQDFYYQGMTWAAKSSLYSLEANAKFALSERGGWLVGLRWLRLKDTLTGSLTPGDTNEPLWKTGGCAGDPAGSTSIESVVLTTLPGTARPCASGAAVGGYPAFWTTTTTNDLFGVQAGLDGTILSIGRLSLSGVAKFGVYDNSARQSATVSMQKQMYDASARRNRLAFVGQAGLQVRYAFAGDLVGKAGYELLWLEHVALAPGQIDQTVSVATPGSVTAAGVNTGASVLLQAFTIGIEYAF